MINDDKRLAAVDDATMFLMNYLADVPVARSMLKNSGLSPEDIALAELMAANNLFAMAFNRRYELDGTVKAGVVMGEG